MVLLSFDTEEFDVPREHGVEYDTLKEGMEVSKEGTCRILDVLKQNNVKATFFCTGNFATHAPEVMKRIMDEGHEVACHGVDHWEPKASDFRESKRIVEEVTGTEVRGYRQPRMFPVSDEEIATAGYWYNSSLNPALHSGTLYAPDGTAHLVHEGRGDADSGIGDALDEVPAVLAVAAQLAAMAV